MDAHRITYENLKECIEKGWYQITGILETGELTVAILSNTEIDIINKALELSDEEGLEIIKKMSLSMGDREECLEAYKQLRVKVLDYSGYYQKNGLPENLYWKSRLRLRGKVIY
jgi:DNA-binding NarL/FixJ family response regulator